MNWNLLSLRLSSRNQDVSCRHPVIDLADFNCSYLNKLLDNISKEQKSVFQLREFNVNPLNYYGHS